MKAFITPQFSYCPRVWMFHSRTLNNRINKIHKRALRLVYKNETFHSFDDLLKRAFSEHSPEESTNPCDRDL